MYKKKGFTLVELAVVVLVAGIIMLIAARYMPRVMADMQYAKRAADFKSAEQTLINYIRSLPLGSGKLPNMVMGAPSRRAYFYTFYDFTYSDGKLLDLSDSNGKPWGYVIVPQLAESADICSLDLYSNDFLIYQEHGPGGTVEIRDVVMVLYTNDPDFISKRIAFSMVQIHEGIVRPPSEVAMQLTMEITTKVADGFPHTGYLNYESGDRELFRRIFTIGEVKELAGCPSLDGSGFVEAVTMPPVYKGIPYRNILTIYNPELGGEYCFERTDITSTGKLQRESGGTLQTVRIGECNTSYGKWYRIGVDENVVFSMDYLTSLFWEGHLVDTITMYRRFSNGQIYETQYAIPLNNYKEMR